MSINITAFKCNNKTYFFDKFEENFDKFKDDAFETLKSMYAKEVIRYAVNMYDEDYVGLNQNKENNDNYIHLAIKSLLVDEKFNRYIPPRMNIGFSLVFFDSSLYIIMNNYNNNKLLEVFKKYFNEYLEDYSYWNNTDKPKNISEKEWDERAQTLKEIIYKNLDRSDNIGLKYDLIGKYTIINLFDYIYKPNKLEFLPDAKDRAKYLAKQKLVLLICDKKMKNVDKNDNVKCEKILIDSSNKVLFKEKRYLKILDKIISEYLKKINKDISYKDIFE